MKESYQRGIHRSVALALGAITLALSGCASQQSQPESWDGLQLVPSKNLESVYVQPGVEFPAYKSVMIDPLEVAFAKDWDPNRDVRSPSRWLKDSDIQAIRDGLARLFREQFEKELTSHGYAVVTSPGEETLRVTPAVIDLYINAPDRMEPGMVTTYTTEAGRMTLVMELRDSFTGDVIARAVDRKRARNAGYMQVTNSVTNTADARRAIDVWAKALREGLDEVNGRG